MATTTGVDQQAPGAGSAEKRPNPSAAEVLAASVRPAEQAAVRTAERARSGQRGRGRARIVLKWMVRAALVVIMVLAYFLWRALNPVEELPEGFAKSNGRIEATEIDIATKLHNRIAEVLADDGDYVSAGQVLAKMDLNVLSAELREAQAQHRLAKSNVDAARATVTQREARGGGGAIGRRDAQGPAHRPQPALRPHQRAGADRRRVGG